VRETTTFGIGEAARQTGLEPSAIRYYEEAGLIAPPPRVSGRRRYDADHLDQLRVVTLARVAGFSVREVRLLMGRFQPREAPAVRWKALATRKLAALDEQARRLNRMRQVLRNALAGGCLTLEECAPLLKGC